MDLLLCFKKWYRYYHRPFLTAELVIRSIRNLPLQEQKRPVAQVKQTDVFEQVWLGNREVIIFYEAQYLDEGKIETIEFEMPEKAKGRYSTMFRNGSWFMECPLGFGRSFKNVPAFNVGDRLEILKAVHQVFYPADIILDSGVVELDCPPA